MFFVWSNLSFSIKKVVTRTVSISDFLGKERNTEFCEFKMGGDDSSCCFDDLVTDYNAVRSSSRIQ